MDDYKRKPRRWRSGVFYSILLWRLKPQADYRLLIAVQPFADEMANHACHDCDNKRCDYFHMNTSSLSPVQEAVTNGLYHRKLLSSTYSSMIKVKNRYSYRQFFIVLSNNIFYNIILQKNTPSRSPFQQGLFYSQKLQQLSVRCFLSLYTARCKVNSQLRHCLNSSLLSTLSPPVPCLRQFRRQWPEALPLGYSGSLPPWLP